MFKFVILAVVVGVVAATQILSEDHTTYFDFEAIVKAVNEKVSAEGFSFS
tara:strand:+ start:277 stop:426 length:150 start_codon:yes stop_codon:yes gene_type:complete